ncbi:OmpP1/FadL family transporter [Octadecabacter ascidiaceicola]|uniref:Outer membrane protein transport protein (OMPP1/FadL/TodX) n=1 Tax=Octadecabacter ascidiaceicola TaxID=1655543 RepID=A0A238JLL8_9RHOB|nr:outer membrane protein transport protein [Octadecabacter ascidiaceicola]SMX31303.1 Outer membrane protein transport protein (OMPP1/FadL/TodX) [Octadecabacter ascidiaceicola]
MKKFMTAGAALLMTTSIATAGGLDRSGQGIGVIFEDGDYAELSFGSVSPDVSGVGIGGTTGNVTPNYMQLGMAYKTQLSDQASLAIIYDQPFGAQVDYDTGSTYILTTTSAKVESDGVTVLGRYEINPNFSFHGGLRYVQVEGTYNRAAIPGIVPAYQSDYSSDSGIGYVIGGAYEREDIALRLAVTYSSEIDLELGSSGFGSTALTTTIPESVNVDFQTGIAADTLLFGSVRYVAWDGFKLIDDSPLTPTPIVEYDDDVYTYTLGVGRRITDQLSASFAIGYENSTGETTGNLGPTDGFISYQIGAKYTMDNGVAISGGVRYVDIGDAVTDPPVGGAFNDNDAIALGLKIGYSF